MKQQLGSAVTRLKGRVGKGGKRGGVSGGGDLGRLKRRVAELENEVQENRRLNRRVAELLDIVEELLVPIAQRDDDRVRAYLDAHGADLQGPELRGPESE